MLAINLSVIYFLLCMLHNTSMNFTHEFIMVGLSIFCPIHLMKTHLIIVSLMQLG